LIREVKPSFYVKGVDYIGIKSPGLDREREAIAEVGGQMRFTGTQKWSSSSLLTPRSFRVRFAPILIRKGSGCQDKILSAFDRADDKAILFVGEAITDVIAMCRALAGIQGTDAGDGGNRS